jgi:protein ImuB
MVRNGTMGFGSPCMKGQTPKPLYAAVHATEFPAQAMLRLRPDLKSQPVVILHGNAPKESVCAINSHARIRGATLGMTRLEAEEIDGMRLLPRSESIEAASRSVLLECLAQFSPRIEEASRGTACIFVLDIAGTERLFGPPQKLADRIRNSLLLTGFHASIAVSSNYDAARMKSEIARGITVIPAGEEASALAKLPLSSLQLPDDRHETFALWGIRRLGEIAALPELELISRFGQDARIWGQLARGEARHAFQPIEPHFSLEEYIEFETHVEQMDSLLFIGASMIDSLVSRAASRALSLAIITVHMSLEGGLMYERVIRPALPSTDRKFLLKLLQLEIAAHPPQAAVVSLTLTAEAGQSSKVQLGLFAPQTPEPSQLDVTLARIKALVGDKRVGSPTLEDTHQPGRFHKDEFSVDSLVQSSPSASPRIALRRMRPPVPVRVALNAMRPAIFRDGAKRYEVMAAYGPWKTSGCWWSTSGWETEEWDVMAVDNYGEEIGCLLVLDCMRNQWHLDAIYD